MSKGHKPEPLLPCPVNVDGLAAAPATKGHAMFCEICQLCQSWVLLDGCAEKSQKVQKLLPKGSVTPPFFPGTAVLGHFLCRGIVAQLHTSGWPERCCFGKNHDWAEALSLRISGVSRSWTPTDHEVAAYPSGKLSL